MLGCRASSRRLPLTAPRRQWRAAWRVAAGLSPTALARAEAASEREVAALLAEPDFQELVEALREFEALPEAERLKELERCAWQVLQMALADGDWRAAAFVADQIARGLSPARTLARGVVKSQAHPAEPSSSPARSAAAPLRPPRAYDPVAAGLRCGAAVLRERTAAETLVVATARPAPVAAPSAPAEPARPRRRDPLAARLRGGSALPPAPAASDPRGLLRAWARAP
jgi:hypothetical protein